MQLRVKLEELQKQGGKKVILGLETIQAFSKIRVSTIPSKKADIPKALQEVDAYIAEQERLHQEHLDAQE